MDGFCSNSLLGGLGHILIYKLPHVRSWKDGVLILNKESLNAGLIWLPFKKENRSKVLLQQGSKLFDKGAKAILWRRDSLFHKWHWDNWMSMYQKMNLDSELTPFTKINSKWIIDLNVTWKTVKLLEENIGGNLCDFGFGDEFLSPKPKAWKDLNPVLSSTVISSVISIQQRPHGVGRGHGLCGQGKRLGCYSELYN